MITTYRQWFRQQLKEELKGSGRKRSVRRTLRANGVKPSLDKCVMYLVGYKGGM